MRKRIRKIFKISLLKSIWFNFKVFNVGLAIRFPVLLSKNTVVTHCYRGCFELRGGGTIGLLRIGFDETDLYPDNKCVLAIWGKIIVNGCKPHMINSGTVIHVRPRAVLSIGDGFTCSGDTKIICAKSITIGDDNMWSFNNIIMDTDSHELYVNGGINMNQGIIFGKHVWLGCGSQILKGTIIPDNCVVAAGSVLTASKNIAYKQASIINSNGIIKENICWRRNAMFEEY